MVYFYDLRSFNAPTSVIEAHTSEVSSVKFQPGKAGADVSSLFSSISENSRTTDATFGTLFSPPILTEKKKFNADTTFSNTSTAMKENLKPESSNTSMGSQVFSPIRDISIGNGQSFGMAKTPILHTSSHSRFSTESIFSPLRETSFNSPFTSVPGVKTPLLASIHEESLQFTSDNVSENKSLNKSITKDTQVSFDTKDKFNFENEDDNNVATDEPVTYIKNSIQTGKETQDFNKDFSQSKNESEGSKTTENMDHVIISSSTPFYMPKIKLNEQSISEGSESCSEPLIASPSQFSNSNVDVKDVLTAFPQALSPKGSCSNSSIKALPISHQNEEKEEVEVFKQKYVQAAVEECMDDFCCDMRKHLWHIHYDILKSFQTQKAEIENVLRRYAINETLLEEMKRLREENEKLKSTPFVGHFTDDKNEDETAKH